MVSHAGINLSAMTTAVMFVCLRVARHADGPGDFVLWLTSLGVQLSGSNGCATCKALSMQMVRVQQHLWSSDWLVKGQTCVGPRDSISQSCSCHCAHDESACLLLNCAYIYDRYVRVHPLEAEAQWQHQYAASGNTPERGVAARGGWRVRELVLIGGLVLPIWGMVERALVKQHRPADRRMHVLRLHTTGSHTLFVLCCAVLCCAVLCCAVLCCAVL